MPQPLRAVRRSPVVVGIRRSPALALLAPLALSLAGCPDGGKDKAPPGKQIVKPDPSLDSATTLRRGPWLNAPSAGTVTVSWTTDEPSSSRVEVTPEGGEAQVVEGIVFKPVATTDDPILAGTLPETFQHEVVLEGLGAGQRYTYRILSAADPKPEGSLHGQPEPGDDFRFLLFGDTRSNDASHTDVITAMTDRLAQEGPAAFVLHTGDLVTTGGSEGNWDDFFRIEGPLLGEVPILPTYGNHEAILGRTLFEGHFASPPTSTGSTDRWYSVDVGDVHLAVIDPYAMELEPHLDWLEDDLATSTARFKVLVVHAPLYTFSNHPPDFALRDELLPMLAATDVHLVMSGHNHCYERFFGQGIHFVVSGGGGAPLYGTDDSPEADNTGAVRRAQDAGLHYVFAQRTGDQIRFETFSVPENTSIDCFVIDAAQPGAELACQD